MVLSNYGYGDGDGYGYGSGYGDGYGDGYGYGDGDGYGYGSGEIEIPKEKAWTAYHYIRKQNGKYLMRDGTYVQKGQAIHEDVIKMCECGLHAGLSISDAKQYKPSNSVLTKVAVFGRVIVGKNKLVATDRYIIEEVDA